MHHRLQKAGDEMLISTKWVTGNPSDHDVSVLSGKSDPFAVPNLIAAAIVVPVIAWLISLLGHIAFGLWFMAPGFVSVGFLTCAVVLFKKEREAQRVYDRFANAGRIHSTGHGSLFYYLKQAVNGDVTLLEHNPDKVDAFLVNGTIQEAYKSLAENAGLSEELKAQHNTTIKTQVDSCVEAIRAHSY